MSHRWIGRAFVDLMVTVDSNDDDDAVSYSSFDHETNIERETYKAFPESTPLDRVVITPIDRIKQSTRVDQ